MISTFYHENRYYQIWDATTGIYTRRGDVGTINAPITESSNSIAELTRFALDEGFREFPEDGFNRFVVYYILENWELNEVASFAHVVESILSETIQFSGLGKYDGFTQSNDSLSFWFLVVNEDLAVNMAIETLKRNGCYEDDEFTITIANLPPAAEQYHILFPPSEYGNEFFPL